MVLNRDGVIQEYHHGVPRKPLECPLIVSDDTSRLGLIFTQHIHHVFGVSGFGKGGEPSQVEEEHRDISPMTLQKAIRSPRHNHLTERLR